MERKGASLAQELRRWAAEEMKLPLSKIPSESAARRMCSGQCAEIWNYVIRHVHHQRNVKKIRGNVLWYQQMEEAKGNPGSSESEKERRKQLVQGIARLREELQQIDLQIESAQRELVADEVTLETSQEMICDAKRRSLLLKAYSARVASERQQLRARTLQVKGRLEQLEEMEKYTPRIQPLALPCGAPPGRGQNTSILWDEGCPRGFPCPCSAVWQRELFVYSNDLFPPELEPKTVHKQIKAETDENVLLRKRCQ